MVRPSKSRVVGVTDALYAWIRDRNAGAAADAETTAGFGSLAGCKYALLISYRRTGEGVPSPVWFGRDEQDRVYFATGEAAGKVKRIRANPQVRLAPCDLRGKPAGPPAVGTARVLPPAETEYAEQAIAANYGMGRRLYTGAGRMLSEATCYIEVTPTP